MDHCSKCGAETLKGPFCKGCWEGMKQGRDIRLSLYLKLGALIVQPERRESREPRDLAIRIWDIAEALESEAKVRGK